MRKILYAATLLAISGSVLADVAVIVNPANSEALDANTVSRLFLGKQKGLTPYNLPEGNAVRDEFDAKVLGKSSSQLKAYWSKLIFTGGGTPPKQLDDAAAVKAKVASDANAIGYIPADAVDSSVKVIKTW